MKSLIVILEDIRAAIATGVGTVATGVGTAFEKFPTDLGTIASIIGSVATVVFVIMAFRRDKRESKENKLRVELLKTQLRNQKLGKGGELPPDDD